MPVRNWSLRRTGSQRAIALSLAFVTALTAFLLAAISGYNARAQAVGIRDYLAAMDATDASLQVQVALAKDPAAQQLAAEGLFAQHFGALPVTIYRSVTVPPVPVTAAAGIANPPAPVSKGDGTGSGSDSGGGAGTGSTSPATVRLADFDRLAEHAHLLAGTWLDLADVPANPADPATIWPAAIDSDVATALGLSLGDTLVTGSPTALTTVVRAIWAPNSARDPYFTADAAGSHSADALAADRAALGFVVVDVDALRGAGSSPVVNWTVVPRRSGVLPPDLPGMARAVAGLPTAMITSSAVAPAGVLAAGDLAGTLGVVTASVVAASAVGLIPALSITAISLVMVIQLARLLALHRRAETALVRSRGASVGRLVRVAAVEAALIVLPALAVAIGGAAAVSGYLGMTLPAIGWAAAVAVGVAAGVVIVIPAAHQARLPANRQSIDDSGRIRTVVAIGTVALLGMVAAIAWWRLSGNGSAVVTTATGDVRVDPVAAIAAPAVLVAAALAAGAVFAALDGFFEWATVRRRGVGAWLVTRSIARRTTVFGIIVVLISIAFGSVGMAAVYAPTQRAAQQQTNILRNGAPLNVALPGVDALQASAYSPPDARLVARALGSEQVIAALQREVSIGDASVLLTGVPLGGAASSEVLPAIPGSFEPAALAGVLRSAKPAIALPAGATEINVGIRVALAWHKAGAVTNYSDGPPIQESGGPGPEGIALPLSVAVWIQGVDGALAPVATSALPPVPVAPIGPGHRVEATLSVPLPGLSSGSSIVAIDVIVPSVSYPLDIEMSISALAATVGPDDGAGAGGASDAADAGGADPEAADRSEDLNVTTVDWAAAPQPRVTNSGMSQLLDYQLATAGAGLSGPIPAGQINTVRLTATPTGPLPVAINPALARALDLSVGDAVVVNIDAARQIPARVAVISPLLPGASDQSAILSDLRSLGQTMLATIAYLPAVNQVWVAQIGASGVIAPAGTSGTDGAQVAATIRSIVAPTATITAADTLSIGSLADPAAVTLWVGAIGALLLATVGTGSVIAGLARSRRSEAVVMRASGVPARRQSALRRAELWITLGASWLAGAAVAVVGVLLTARTLAGSAVVGLNGAEPALRAEIATAAVALGAHAVVMVAIVIVHGRRVRRTAELSVPSELVM